MPFQTTTSPILPASSVPVWSRMPSAFAGFAVTQRIARSGGMSSPRELAARHRLRGFLVQALDALLGVGVHDGAAALREVDERDVLLDAVVGLHLEAPPVGPERAADAFGREAVRELVRLDAVVERGDLEAELLRR